MDDNHPHPGKTFGTRGADIIFAQHFQHRGARHTHNDRQRDGTQHNGGQDHMGDGIDKVTVFTPDGGVDQHKTG
ncbi:Uncharacterised protein [Klebsiella pneumoniae]|nr:Uncharacterised protein [Klebsiella pneumoniae]